MTTRAAGPADDVAAFRAGSAAYLATQPRALAHLPRGTWDVVDAGPDAPVRELMVYRPAHGPAVPGVFVNLHGGGFVLADWQGDDPYCRLLADTAGCVVVNVDYPVAPEQPFPAAVHHTYALLAWIAAHGPALGADGTRLAVGGHSAGGNLAAALALLARRRGGPDLRGVVVDYAPLDLSTAPGAKLPADADPGAAALAAAGARFNAWYLPDPADGADELASPGLAHDLSGLPPTLVLTAERDLLRADGDRFAARLRAAGVDTEHVVYPDCGHAFTHVGPEQHAADAWARMAGFLRRVLGSEPR